MARRASQDMTIEEFDRWREATREVRDVMEATAEEGGPRLSLVPDPKSAVRDIAPIEVPLPVPTTAAGVIAFDPEPSRRVYAAGWSADRQRLYIETLAETGSVHLSAKAAGLSARSAYALRVARRHFRRPGTPRNNWPSAGSPPSPSTAPSMAGSSKSIIRANWSAKSACRASGC